MADAIIPVSTRLRRSTPYHDAYTVRVYDQKFAALATARPADARRWVGTTRWLHGGLINRGRLIVGLGVQWTPTRRPLYHGSTHVPATLQLCVGHRCLVFHLARADAVPEALRRFLADPRVTFVGSGSDYDGRMLWEHYGLDVARGQELRAVAGMGNASVEQMADWFLGYPGIYKPRDVAMSAWHAPRLEVDQVQYASVDAYLAFRLGVALLVPGVGTAPPPPPARAQAQAQQRAPAVQRVPAIVNPAPPPPVHRAPAVVVRQRQAPAPVVVLPLAPPAFIGVPVPAVGGDAAITCSKIMGTHVGLAGWSDTESEMDSYDDVYRAATFGLPVRAYASDSDYSLDSSDGFEEDFRFGAFTDEEADDGSYTGSGSLAADDVDGNGNGNGDEDEDEDEEGCDEDDQDDEEEEDCNDDMEDEEGCNEDDQEEGYDDYTSGAAAGMDGSAELVSNEVVIDAGCDCEEDDDALAQDDWYDQEVDEQEEFEEFYLL